MVRERADAEMNTLEFACAAWEGAWRDALDNWPTHPILPRSPHRVDGNPLSTVISGAWEPPNSRKVGGLFRRVEGRHQHRMRHHQPLRPADPAWARAAAARSTGLFLNTGGVKPASLVSCRPATNARWNSVSFSTRYAMLSSLAIAARNGSVPRLQPRPKRGVWQVDIPRPGSMIYRSEVPMEPGATTAVSATCRPPRCCSSLSPFSRSAAYADSFSRRCFRWRATATGAGRRSMPGACIR